MRFTVSRQVACPPEAMYAKLADARNEVHWNPYVTSSELVSGDGTSEGSTFRTVNRGQTYDAVLTTAEPPRRLVFDITGKPMDMEARFELAPSATGTAFDGAFELRPKSFMRLLTPLLKVVFARGIEQQADALAAYCERPDGNSGQPAAAAPV